MGCNSCGDFCLGPLRHCQTGRQVLRQQRLRLQNAKNTMTSKAITTFNQFQLRPLVCMARPLHLFWVASRRNMLICLVIPEGAPVAPPVPVPGCVQKERCRLIGLCANLIWYYQFFFLLLSMVGNGYGTTSGSNFRTYSTVPPCMALFE